MDGMQRRSWSPPRSGYGVLLIGPRRSSWLYSITVDVGHSAVFTTESGIQAVTCARCCWYLEFGLGLTTGTRLYGSPALPSTIYLPPHWPRATLAD